MWLLASRVFKRSDCICPAPFSGSYQIELPAILRANNGDYLLASLRSADGVKAAAERSRDDYHTSN